MTDAQRQLIFFGAAGATIGTVLGTGILLWSWPAVLIFAVPVFGIGPLLLAYEWLHRGGRARHRAQRARQRDGARTVS